MAAGRAWQGWMSFALGLWLAVSPWFAGYSDAEAATANAALVGIGLALASHFEASFDEAMVHWAILAAGAWLCIAPFVCGFSLLPVPTINCLVVGLAVAVLSSSALGFADGIGKRWDWRNWRTIRG